MVTLRPYQAGALDRLRGQFSLGLKRILLVAPTGAGKTTMAGEVISGAASKGNKCIFLAHRTELIEQCSGRLDEMGVPHGVIQSGSKRHNPEAIVQVASIQTLIRRDHFDAKIIFVDEAHRSTSQTYIKLLERYNNPSVVGLTATPYRADGKGLGMVDRGRDQEPFELYQSLVEVAPVQELIDLGYLVMPTVYGAPEIDMSNVRITAGDYNNKDAANVMDGTVLRGDLLKNWAIKCGAATGAISDFDHDGKLISTTCNACTVVFAPSIRHSNMIVEQFKAAGVSAAHIDGKTEPEKRASILRDLRNRTLTVVSNFGILCEGWDLPHLEAIIGSRPTRSRNLAKQMIGRLMRPDDDKRFAFLFDHSDWTRTHGFVNEPETFSLLGREKRPRKGDGGAPVRECPDCMELCHISTPICNGCGYEFPRRELQYTDEELVELNAGNINNGRPRAHAIPLKERQDSFNKWCLRCQEEEYNPNWARMQYQRVYGEWPSRQTGIATPKFFWKYSKGYTAPAKHQGERTTA